MSRWTDIRDNVVTALNVEEVTEEVKQNITQSIIENIFPAIEQAADNFCNKIKEQAPNEKGWCKVRDGIVLPLLIQGTVYIVKKVLTNTLPKVK